MRVKLLTEYHLEFLSLTGGYTGSSESTLVKMPHCWKSHVTAHMSGKGYITGVIPISLFLLATGTGRYCVKLLSTEEYGFRPVGMAVDS